MSEYKTAWEKCGRGVFRQMPKPADVKADDDKIARLQSNLSGALKREAAGKAFHDLAVGERNRAWDEVAELKRRVRELEEIKEAAEARVRELEGLLEHIDSSGVLKSLPGVLDRYIALLEGRQDG